MWKLSRSLNIFNSFSPCDKLDVQLICRRAETQLSDSFTDDTGNDATSKASGTWIKLQSILVAMNRRDGLTTAYAKRCHEKSTLQSSWNLLTRIAICVDVPRWYAYTSREWGNLRFVCGTSLMLFDQMSRYRKICIFNCTTVQSKYSGVYCARV